MPSVSKKQHNLMAAVAHSPSFAKKVGIPTSVGKDFMTADKGKKFREGGTTKHDDILEDKKLIKKAVDMHDKQLHGGKKTNLYKLKEGGMARMKSKGEHGVQKQSKRGAEVVKMAVGGLPSQAAPQAAVGMANRPAMPAQGNAGGAMRGLDRAAAMSGRTFSKGGSASKRADGCATKGKTKGKMI